jgi:hypothetical protein
MAGRRTRKNVPWKGWSGEKPGFHEKTVMLQKCGKKCFLGPNKTFPICKKNLDDMILIDEGHVCSKILQMYNESGYIIEPAGVLSLCALDLLKPLLHNKK